MYMVYITKSLYNDFQFNDFQRVGFKNANLNFRNPTVQKLCICKIGIFTVFYRLAWRHIITLINYLIGQYKWALN